MTDSNDLPPRFRGVLSAGFFEAFEAKASCVHN